MTGSIWSILGIGALALGSVACGASDDASDSAGDASEITEVVTGQLVERQQEMLQIVEALDASLQAGSADAALVDRLFVPQGIYRIGGAEYRADDGTLAEFFELGSDRSAAPFPPALVADDLVVRLGDYGGGKYSQTVRFTSSGEVLIIWSQITN